MRSIIAYTLRYDDVLALRLREVRRLGSILVAADEEGVRALLLPLALLSLSASPLVGVVVVVVVSAMSDDAAVVVVVEETDLVLLGVVAAAAAADWAVPVLVAVVDVSISTLRSFEGGDEEDGVAVVVASLSLAVVEEDASFSLAVVVVVVVCGVFISSRDRFCPDKEGSDDVAAAFGGVLVVVPVFATAATAAAAESALPAAPASVLAAASATGAVLGTAAGAAGGGGGGAGTKGRCFKCRAMLAHDWDAHRKSPGMRRDEADEADETPALPPPKVPTSRASM